MLQARSTPGEHQALPLMESPPMRLMINPDVTPTAYHSHIPVPLHWLDAVKAGLDRDVRLGVLEPVPIGEPVTWCHQHGHLCQSFVPNRTAHTRRMIDFQPFNLHATRETHHTQSPFYQARSVPQGKKKTVFDAWNGYHSVPLYPNDRHSTTFIIPLGPLQISHGPTRVQCNLDYPNFDYPNTSIIRTLCLGSMHKFIYS